MNNEEVKTIQAFCASCQTVEDHTYSVDSNGELLFHCIGDDCNRFFKFPKGLTLDEKLALLQAHHEDNLGQVSLQDSIDELEEFVAAVNQTPAEVAPVDTSTETVDTNEDTTVIEAQPVE